MIINNLMHDKISKYYESLIEMQANNPTIFHEIKDEYISKDVEKSKAKKLTKCSTRGRLNK